MTPPRLARRILAWLAAPDVRPWLLDDLDDAFGRRAAVDVRRARRWYWRQALGGSLALTAMRCRRRAIGALPSNHLEDRMNGTTFLAASAQDARHSWRAFRRQPVYGAAAVLSLALGIGASTAMFSVIDGVLLRPLNLPEPGQLMLVGERLPEIPSAEKFRFFDNPAAFLAWRREASEFSGLAAIQPAGFTMPIGGAPQFLPGAHVSTNFFDVLAVRPALGRLLAGPDEGDTTRPMVITDRLWRAAFDADPGVIGRRIGVPGIEATVVGVLPPDFHVEGKELGPMISGPTDFFDALKFPKREHQVFSDFNYTVLGRLRPGVTEAAALAHLDAIQANLARTAPQKLQLYAELSPVRDFAVHGAQQELWLLFGGVLAVLLIVCVNLGGLSITRATDRRRDWAIRAALGAAPGRLARQVLGESVVLACLGGVLGVACATGALKALLALAPADVPRLDEVHANWHVFAFGFAVSLTTGLVTGLVLALRLRRADPHEFLKATAAATTADLGSLRSRQVLIGVQAALSTVLLVVAALLGISFSRLLAQPTGFDASHAVAADVMLGAYVTEDARDALLRQLSGAVGALPGVTAAGFTSQLPLRGEAWIDSIDVPGRNASAAEQPHVNVRFVSPGYFTAIGIPLTAGRDISERDRPSGPPPTSAATEPPGIIVLSRATAQMLWPGTQPSDLLGRGLDLEGHRVAVVGIAADTRASLDAPAPAIVYVPYWEQAPGKISVVARSTASVSVLAGALREAIRNVAPLAPIPLVQPLDDLEGSAVASQRYQFTLLVTFASIALLLAAMGVYALVAHSVAKRRKELALRITLGARASDLWKIILGQSPLPVAVGAIAGVAPALAGGRLLATFLFEVSPTSPAVLVPAPAAVLAAAAIACVLSARSGIAAQPWGALRDE
jgi:predicted permease